MRMYDIIRKKRDGLKLTTEEIQFFAKGYLDGSIPEYQVSALLMAIYYKGLSQEELLTLTLAVRDSGERLDFSKVKGIRVDKHSTGGVGDKTSLVVVPIVAALGIKVAKMSGRGLGHTGGTIDKLQSIPGFNTNLSEERFLDIVNEVGSAIVGQTADMAPLDKMLYALRDVTATVDSIPLIVSSIMGKKLAADDDCIVLDVKTGSGSFMKTYEASTELAKTMVEIGKAAGKKMVALITNMDEPLGQNIGNALEVQEAIDTLKGKGPKDFEELCVILASAMLYVAGKGPKEVCRENALRVLKDGTALQKLREMIAAQEGNPDSVDDYSLFPNAPIRYELKSPMEGYIQRMDTERVGTASQLLGAGRNTIKDQIDLGAGIRLLKKTGDFVKAGEVIAIFHTSDEKKIPAAREMFESSLSFSNEAPERIKLVLGTVE